MNEINDNKFWYNETLIKAGYAKAKKPNQPNSPLLITIVVNNKYIRSRILNIETKLHNLDLFKQSFLYIRLYQTSHQTTQNMHLNQHTKEKRNQEKEMEHMHSDI